MSCIHCFNTIKEGIEPYACFCDDFVHPLPLSISAGLSSLPRQVATFPEFRRAMLQTLKSAEVELIDRNNQLINIIPLAGWKARDKDDLGIMLLEMWAYICDSLSFYDEVIANETYLRTSRRRPDLRRLIAVLGYLPRPAVGSVVDLAALAEGRLTLRLPAGTAFSSGAFNGNPPQVFELDKEAFIHPLLNRWKILSPHPGIITGNNPGDLLVSPKTEIKEDTLLLIINSNQPGQNKGMVVKKLEKYTGADAQQYTKVIFTGPSGLLAGAPLVGLRLLKATQTVPLWMGNDEGLPSSAKGSPAPKFSGSLSLIYKTEFISQAPPDITGINNTLTLNSLVPQIKAGQFILVSYAGQVRWFMVVQVLEVNRQAVPSSVMVINGNKFSLPGISVPVTQLTIDVNINSSSRSGGTGHWGTNARGGITVHYALQIAGTIIDEPNTRLTPTDPLLLDGFLEAPVDAISAAQFLLQDKNTLGTSLGGSIDYPTKQLKPDQGTSWYPGLTLPVEAFGNVIRASRGEKVINEIMGSGDASLPNQTFKLKKKPLTYHLSPTAGNDDGVSNSLTIYVNGIKWAEVSTFYGKKEDDQVFIVRQNDDDESLVTFGDGTRGERLPSGINNVVAGYRFGAGAACPPPGSVNQITKPVKGLQSVKNILPAFGGADAEGPESLRKYAPKSALILGRVVSMKDMEALAGQFPGVRAVQTEWRWNKGKQCASAQIFYIGEDGLAASLSARLRNVSDPSTSITVEKALTIPLTISLNVQIDPRHLEADVLQQLRQLLLDKQSGMLAPENIGIGQPLYRSKIFGVTLQLAGTTTVESILLNGNNFDVFAVTPGAGHYFDIEQGKLILNGKEN